MTSRFKFRPVSGETVNQRAKQSGGDYDSYIASDVLTLKVKEGDVTLRILPATWSAKKYGDNWGMEVWVHGNIGVDNATYLCSDKMKGETCPLCEARGELSGDEASALKPRKRILCWVIDRDNEKLGPQVWNLGWKMEKDIQVRSLDKKTGEVVQITDPESGYDVEFTREGTKLNTQYVGVSISRDPTSISEKEVRQEKWLQFIEENPIPELLVFHEPDYIEKVYMGKSSKEDEDDKDERPKRRGRSKPKDEEEEEDKPKSRRGSAKEEEEEEDRPRHRGAAKDEEEEDGRPKRRGSSGDKDEDDDKPKSRRGAAKDEEEEEDDKPKRRNSRGGHDKDEEEEEDKPKSRRGSAKEEEEEEDRPRRRGAAKEEEEEEDDVATARRKVSSLKGRGGRDRH